MAEMMQALMLTAFNKQELVEVPVPSIQKPDEVLLKVNSVGVCGSDLHGYTGQTGRRTPPMIMGHEVAAEVVAVGEAVIDLPLGTHVAIQPVKRPRPNIAESMVVLGVHTNGAYAPYVVWPAGNLFPLPPGLSDDHGAMAEPLSIALHAVSIPHIRPGDTAFIAGAGPIGLLTLAVLRKTGVQTIAISDLSEDRLKIAQRIGADVLINPSRQNAREVVQGFTAGQGVDLAFEAVGISPTAQQTLAVVRNQGTVIWIGNNLRLIEIDMQMIVTRELRVLGSYGMTDVEFQRSLDLLAQGAIPTEDLINRYAELDDGPALFDQLIASPETIKCIIKLS